MKKISLIIALAFVINLAVPGATVSANPSYFPPTVQTATASSTVSYMTPGAATTTLTFDSYYMNTIGRPTKAEAAALLVQYAGSSTASTLNINIEYSQDGVDWYSDSLIGALGSGTTTPLMNLATNNSYSWKFASSTVGGAGVTAASGATSTKAIFINTPTRYVRAIFSMAVVANGNGAIWAQMVPTKEMNN